MIRKIIVRTRLMMLLFVLSVSPALLKAHHGSVGLNESTPVTMTGIATDFKFTNPHVTLFFDVKNEKSKTVNWRVEGPSVVSWVKVGWNRTMIKPGDKVVVSVFRSKTGKPEGVLQKLVLANGKQWCCESY